MSSGYCLRLSVCANWSANSTSISASCKRCGENSAADTWSPYIRCACSSLASALAWECRATLRRPQGSTVRKRASGREMQSNFIPAARPYHDRIPQSLPRKNPNAGGRKSRFRPRVAQPCMSRDRFIHLACKLLNLVSACLKVTHFDILCRIRLVAIRVALRRNRLKPRRDQP